MRRWIPLILFVLVLVVMTSSTWACPFCKDSVPNSDAQQAGGVPSGFNNTIYLMLASLVSMEIAALTFSIPIAALAAALIGRLESLWITLAAAFVIGIIQAELNAFSSLAEYRNMTPFVCAILVLLWFGWRRQVEGRVA